MVVIASVVMSDYYRAEKLLRYTGFIIPSWNDFEVLHLVYSLCFILVHLRSIP